MMIFNEWWAGWWAGSSWFWWVVGWFIIILVVNDLIMVEAGVVNPGVSNQNQNKSYTDIQFYMQITCDNWKTSTDLKSGWKQPEATHCWLIMIVGGSMGWFVGKLAMVFGFLGFWVGGLVCRGSGGWRAASPWFFWWACFLVGLLEGLVWAWG